MSKIVRFAANNGGLNSEGLDLNLRLNLAIGTAHKIFASYLKFGPQFLHSTFAELLSSGCQIALKGSAIYQGVNSKRVPNDLDVEVFVEGMSRWEDSEIQKFLQKNCGLQNCVGTIFRGAGEAKTFTVNVKDETRGLDFSIYDSNFLPPQHLSWTTN